MTRTDEHTDLLTVAEAALRLRVSPRTIARLIADGQLDAPKVRRRRLIRQVSIEIMLNGQEGQLS